ncbi:MAG: RecQ family ATP-dependent DNA helicase [Candidatus Kapabacteria bacterium]|nr:RecQ family ATP-dependent DNA helicase [Candidatus Kapabacteria bacterium]
MEKILKTRFGLKEFRKGQKEIIQSVLKCKDTLAVMPTGGGKSLCYQLPAIIMPGTAIVISPLIALMKDQVDQLIMREIPAAFINSSQNQDEIQEIFIHARQGGYKIIYVAPERLASRQFIELLQDINLSFIAVDEAHCISEWGHDFRPAYLKVNNIFTLIERVPIIALTATATPDVRQDIIKQLKLQSPDVYIRGFDRNNLRYNCIHSKDKLSKLVNIYRSMNLGSMIVYAGSRNRTIEFSTGLQKLNVPAEFYHGGMKSVQRESVQERFISGQTKVIVATNAFGMGIDKADVRHVVHVDLPQTVEAYYQEAGRAGRDGLDAECTLIYHPEDLKLQDFFIQSTYPPKREISKFVSKVELYNEKISDNRSGFNIIPEAADIANYSGMPLTIVNAIIGFLTRLEIIKPGNSFGESQIRFTRSREQIREYYETTTDERREVLDAILRSVGSEAFTTFCELSIAQLTNRHYINPAILGKAISAFQFAGIIDFRGTHAETRYYLDKTLLKNDNFDVEVKHLERRRIHASEKLKAMQLYAETLRCKRHYILSYFADQDVAEKCGNCSSCG